MANTVKARLHNVIVWVKSQNPQFKVRVYSYLAPKPYLARKWFEEEHPEEEIVKVTSLGVHEYEISRERYRAIYQDSTPV